MLNTSTDLNEINENKKNKKKSKQSKQLKVVAIDLIEPNIITKEALEKEALEKEALKKEALKKEALKKENLEKERFKQEKEALEKEALEKEALEKEALEKAELAINNIDLRYFANQNINPAFKTNKLEQLLSNNYLLKDIYDNIEENIATYKEQIIKYNETTLEKLIENNNKIASGEKYKLYYLLYVLSLITHLKEKKIKNSIKEELKDFNNNSYNNYSADASLNDFNLYNTTVNSMCAKKQITNLDLFVVRKSTNAKRKILPQKRS